MDENNKPSKPQSVRGAHDTFADILERAIATRGRRQRKGTTKGRREDAQKKEMQDM